MLTAPQREYRAMRIRLAALIGCWTFIPLASAQDVALPAIQTAGTDDRGRITVNGQPFFPILMYDVPVDVDSLRRFRAHGFNVLSAPRVEDAELLRAHGFYAAVHPAAEGQNLAGVLFGVGMDSPALNWKDDLLARCKAELAQLQRKCPQRPIFHAIGYWENEPDGVFANLLPSKERYEDLVKTLDVSAPYLYPLPHQPIHSVGDAVRRANEASGGKKALVPVLQLFVWKPEDPYPTPAELKCMVYQSLIHGADGIAYYSYNYVTGKKDTNIAREQPDLWRSVRLLNAEISQIGEFLLEARPDASIQLAAPEDVDRRITRKDASTLILLTNPTQEDRSIKVRVPAEVKRLRGLNGVAIPLRNAAAEVRLAPNESLGLVAER
jgi:hypothetical protein